MSTLTDTLSERLALPLAAACGLGLLWSLASGTWFFLGGAETDVAPPLAAPAERARPDTGRAPLSAAEIAALELFGAAATGELAQRERIADAPETRLQLELQGVFLADDADASSVIVAERNRDGRLYRIGDRLPGNAVLVEVLGDRIVLRRAGQLETLKFPDAAPGDAWIVEGAAGTRDGGRSPLAVAAMRSLQGSSSARPSAVPGAPRGLPTAVPRSGGDATGGMRERLRELDARLNVDPAGTLAELGVAPVAEGSSAGYRLGGEIPSSTLAQVGLRPGDVVLSVNGQAVGDIQQDRARLDSIMNAGSARIEIQRGSRRFFVTTRIR